MLANQEMFSAGFNEFIITVGNVSKSFHAENSKKPQYFDFAARGDSLRLDFVSHYGEEFYCPITFIKVFGTPLHTNVPALIDPVVTDVLKARVEVLESHVRILGLIVVIILTILLFK